ncbi:MAG TPA: 50S ribosomal protein L24 [Candidatus Nanoarchaeia archaeon]|nr:50S ribosomal protein L24 [Candidatus Nanoarchaeia archaeon]
MVKTKFSTHWKKSTQPRKQRKYRLNAPLHLKKKLVNVHLSPELRKKYGLRNIQIRKGDKVKVLRGQFKKQEGKVDRVLIKKERVSVNGVEYIKKDGTKILALLVPSNLLLIELDLSDKKRKQKIESKSAPQKEVKTEKKEGKK